jgi:hypothetical protein
MKPSGISGPILLGVMLTLRLASACGNDASDPWILGPGSTAGNGAGNSGQSPATGGKPATASKSCPGQIPVVGDPCQVPEGELCQWKRSGPCPPDPDQLRMCSHGQWVALAPAIACNAPLPCPEEIPAVGTPCRTLQTELCQWIRGGPCSSDPDQLRVCVDGKWMGEAPAIACNDAGADAGAE